MKLALSGLSGTILQVDAKAQIYEDNYNDLHFSLSERMGVHARKIECMTAHAAHGSKCQKKPNVHSTRFHFATIPVLLVSDGHVMYHFNGRDGLLTKPMQLCRSLESQERVRVMKSATD